MSGRQAQTRGVSLLPEEQQLVDRYRELTGLGLSEQVRQTLLAKLPAAIALLEDMVAAGLSPGGMPPTDRVVYAETEDERRGLREETYEPVDVSAGTAAGG